MKSKLMISFRTAISGWKILFKILFESLFAVSNYQTTSVERARHTVGFQLRTKSQLRVARLTVTSSRHIVGESLGLSPGLQVSQ